MESDLGVDGHPDPHRHPTPSSRRSRSAATLSSPGLTRTSNPRQVALNTEAIAGNSRFVHASTMHVCPDWPFGREFRRTVRRDPGWPGAVSRARAQAGAREKIDSRATGNGTAANPFVIGPSTSPHLPRKSTASSPSFGNAGCRHQEPRGGPPFEIELTAIRCGAAKLTSGRLGLSWPRALSSEW